MTAPGRWVDVSEQDPQPNPIKQAVSALTTQQKAELLKELQEGDE